LHEPACAAGHVSRTLALRAAVAKEIPIRAVCQDIDTDLPLIQTVVPLDKVGIDLSLRAKAGQLAGARRPPQRTCKYVIERYRSQALSDSLCGRFASLGQRQIRKPGMSPDRAPFRSSMSD